MDKINKTVLYDWHLNAKAKMINFHGWMLPLNYSGIISEHMNVRQNIGIFDVSHMGKFVVKGKDAGLFLQEVTTNDIEKLIDNKAQYSLLINEDGFILDDLVVSKINDELFYLIVNAACKDKDLGHIKQQLKNYEVKIDDISNDFSLVAIQGQQSLKLLEAILNLSLYEVSYYGLVKASSKFGEIIVSRLGYTAEDGFEVLISNENVVNFWSELIVKGEDYKVMPTGLGARETLRLEAGYLLYGQDITDKVRPLEAGLGWVTKLNKPYFLGKEALEKNKVADKKLVGILALDKGIPRAGYKVVDKKDHKKIGVITSGGMSPILNQGIGLGYVDLEQANLDNEVLIEIRNQLTLAKIVKPPFVKPQKPLLKTKK